MKNNIYLITTLTILFFLTLCEYGFSQQNYYDVNIGNGKGLRFYGGSNYYKIHFGNSANYKYGPVTDYSIKMNMNNNSRRGWTWGVLNTVPVAALNTRGNFQTAGWHQGTQLYAVGATNVLGYFRRSESYGADAIVKVRGSRNQCTDCEIASIDLSNYDADEGEHLMARISGGMETDAGKNGYLRFFTVQSNIRNEQMRITSAGNVGIGTNAPTGLLHVNGTNNPAIKIGNGASTLTIGSATCNGCWSGVADVNDKVMKLNSSANLIFDTGAAAGANRSFNFVTGFSSHLKIRDNGKVSVGNIGNTPGDYRLYVEKGILTERVRVALQADWADFVFEEDYDLNSTEEVETFIKENGHLPNVPSAEKVSTDGVDVVEMDATLLRQIEELWLHVIELKKENEILKTQVNTLENK